MRSWLVAPLLSLFLPSLVAASDYHYTIRDIWNDRTSEQTQWVSGDKQRVEYRSSTADASGKATLGPRIATIIDCGTARAIELNLDAREYASSGRKIRLTRAEMEQLKEKAVNTRKTAAKPEPKMTIEVNTVDTGERKTLFGHEARHFITTRKNIRHDEPELVDEQVTDGWYFDFFAIPRCMQPASHRSENLTVLLPAQVAKPDEHGRPQFELKHTGPTLPGMPAKQTMRSHQTLRMPDGSIKETTHITESEIVDFSETPIDPATFQVPPGFKKVDHIDTQPPLPFSTRVYYWWERMKYDLSQLFH